MKLSKLRNVRGLFDRYAKLPSYQHSKIYSLQFVDENPSYFTTIYTVLHFVAQQCKDT